MNLPFDYAKINLANGSYCPSMVKAYNNKTFDYWFRALYERAASVFEFTLPENWNGPIKDFFYFCLFSYGFVGVMDREEYGIIFQPGSISGYNIYYQPSKFLYANPLLGSHELNIGEDCELIKMTPYYTGILSIVGKYAEQISALDSAINASILNSRVSFILGGRNRAATESLKKIMDKFYSGEPSIFYDTKLNMDRTDKEDPFMLMERSNLKSNYITPDQLQDLSTLLNNFDKEIGIPTSPYQKKERLTSYESESTMIDATARAITWKRSIDESLKVVNEHFGLNIKCDFRYIPDDDPTKMIQEGGENNEQI